MFMKTKVQKDRDKETNQSQPKAKMRKYYVALDFTVTTVGDEKRLVCSYGYLCIRWHTKLLSAKKTLHRSRGADTAGSSTYGLCHVG